MGLVCLHLRSMLLGLSSHEIWANVQPEGYKATAVDLKKAYDAVVVRQKDARDTSERWFGVRSMELLEVGELSERSEWCRISNVIEVGQVENRSESVSAQSQP